MESVNNKAFNNTQMKTVELDNGDCYEIKRLGDDQVEVCDQSIKLMNKIETVTIDYKNHLMIGFQFRKLSKNIQYRWFNINTQNKILTNSKWGNI